jgi:hypothetical protein
LWRFDCSIWKHTFGFHPMTAFIDHGPEGTGEAAVLLLRSGNAGSNTAADHITAGRLALAQISVGRADRYAIQPTSRTGSNASSQMPQRQTIMCRSFPI